MRRLVVLLISLWLPAAAHAAAPPALTGRVVDSADMIDAATVASITRTLAEFEAKSSDQIVVATVPSLDGEAIEPYANRLFRAWGLGQAKDNNGVLLLVAKADRKMRIEVGYGLEGTLTDLHSSLIIQNTMVPAFRKGDFSGGISKAVDDIISVLQGNGEELKARAERTNPGTSIDGNTIFLVLFGLLWAFIFFGSIAIAVLPRMFGIKIGPNTYRWLGMTFTIGHGGGRGGGWSSGSGGMSSSGGGWSSGGGGGFSGGGGSSGGGGASGGW